jgi:hypothetical protein
VRGEKAVVRREKGVEEYMEVEGEKGEGEVGVRGEEERWEGRGEKGEMRKRGEKKEGEVGGRGEKGEGLVRDMTWEKEKDKGYNEKTKFKW